MFRIRTQTSGWALIGALIAVPLLAAACSTSAVGTGSSNVPDLSQGPGVVDTASPGATVTAAGASSGPLDPCALLTKADVQPFFSVPVVTQLPQPIPGTCEWAANDSPGGVNTSLDVWVTTGQDALDSWTVASGPGPKTMFSGVGDQAEHYPNDPDFVSNKGDVTCKITTVGSAHLAGKMDYPVAAIPDAAATQIAQAYGTLCNKIYGSGPTTPTLTAPPIAASDAGSAAPTAAVSIPPIGGTLGASFPLPAGLDCTGETTTDSSGAITCDATTTGDPMTTYPFFLSVLPAHGYTISHEQEEVSNGKEIASILFGGNDAGGFSSISILGTHVTITVQAP